MSCIILAELLHSLLLPQRPIYGEVVQLSKTSPPALGLLSCHLLLGDDVLGAGLRSQNSGGAPLPLHSPSKQHNSDFYTNRNMKELPQNSLLMPWLSRHLSGLMGVDILETLRPEKATHTGIVTVFLYILLFLHWLLMVDAAKLAFITDKTIISVSGCSFFESEASFFLQFPFRLRNCSHAFFLFV